MNYFELHLGDYAEATSNLSILEDGVYFRLLRKYYAKEKPLPAEIPAVQRLIGARSKEEKAAVEAVLSDFFELEADGWHNRRCDAEIEAYRAGEPEREVKKTNESLRLRKHRDERAELFKRLNSHGQHAPWNTPIKDLRELVAGLDDTDPATPPETKTATPATAPATPATATQTPVPRHQTPDTSTQYLQSKQRAGDSDDQPDDPGPEPTAVGLFGMALKRAGVDMTRVHLGDPRVTALIEQGATPEEVEAIAREAVEARIAKPLGWICTALQGRREKAATLVLAPAPKADPLAWRKSDLGIRAMQRQIGASGPREGESYPDFETRIVAAWRRAGEPQLQTATEAA